MECHRHEALLNLAFAEEAPLSLLCPYDTAGLDGERDRGRPPQPSDDRRRRGAARQPRLLRPRRVAIPFADPLPEPREPVQRIDFGAETSSDLRVFIARRAREAGLGAERTDDLVLAVNEVATNSVRHGGGRGTLRTWQEGGAVICEVRDGGRLDDPLAGRRRPDRPQVGGHGLWLANQVCDLVQLRRSPRASPCACTCAWTDRYGWHVPETESENQRLNRNLDQLLQELRVVLPGVQVLFAFLLAVPFSSRFGDVDGFERDVYFAALLLAARGRAADGALDQHRILFRHEQKRYLVASGA